MKFLVLGEGVDPHVGCKGEDEEEEKLLQQALSLHTW